MVMSRKARQIVLFVAGLILVPLIIYGAIEWWEDEHRLQYHGPDIVNADGTTTHHTIGSFAFTDQVGREITDSVLRGRVSVVNYFFVACPTICPTMNANLKKVHDKYVEDDRVMILSHTVDPRRDSVPVLLQYSKMFHANPDRWHFLTGDKKSIYKVARNDYLINNLEGDGGPTDFIHSEYLVLIDPELHIRGYYEGTNESEVKDLLRDIEVLLSELEE